MVPKNILNFCYKVLKKHKFNVTVAVLFKGSKIFGVEINSKKYSRHYSKYFPKTDETGAYFVPTRHAELRLLKNHKKIPHKNCKLLVLRANKQGLLTNSKPCCFCQKRIKELGIKRVYFITNTQNIQEISYEHKSYKI